MDYFSFLHLFHGKGLSSLFLFNFPNFSKASFANRAHNSETGFIYFRLFLDFILVMVLIIFHLILRHDLIIQNFLRFFSSGGKWIWCSRSWFNLGLIEYVHCDRKIGYIRLSFIIVYYPIALFAFMGAIVILGEGFL